MDLIRLYGVLKAGETLIYGRRSFSAPRTQREKSTGTDFFLLAFMTSLYARTILLYPYITGERRKEAGHKTRINTA